MSHLGVSCVYLHAWCMYTLFTLEIRRGIFIKSFDKKDHFLLRVGQGTTYPHLHRVVMPPLGSNLKHSLWTQEQFRCVLDDFIPSLSSICSTTLNSQNKTVRQMQWPPFINEETNRKVKNIFQRFMTRNLTHLNSNPSSLSLNQAFLSLS